MTIATQASSDSRNRVNAAFSSVRISPSTAFIRSGRK